MINKTIPPDFILDENNNKWDSIVSWIEDDYGTCFAICVDDHCYVVLKGSVNISFKPISYLNNKVFRELKNLPLLK